MTSNTNNLILTLNHFNNYNCTDIISTKHFDITCNLYDDDDVYYIYNRTNTESYRCCTDYIKNKLNLSLSPDTCYNYSNYSVSISCDYPPMNILFLIIVIFVCCLIIYIMCLTLIVAKSMCKIKPPRNKLLIGEERYLM